jgi:hypothetical protein
MQQIRTTDAVAISNAKKGWYMRLAQWLFGWRSSRSVAKHHYRLGLARDKKGDPDGAMDAYSAAISLDNVPDDVKAMALYNRALLFAARGDRSKAAADLNAIMAMTTSVRGVTDAARRRLERLQHRQDAADSSRAERKRTS